MDAVKTTLVIALAFCLWGGVASAALIKVGSEKALYTVINDAIVTGPEYADNTALNAGQDSWELWSIAGGSSTSTMIIEIAGYAGKNRFGIYDPLDKTKKLEIFSGAAGTGSQQTVTVTGNTFSVGGSSQVFGSTAFGFYLDPNATGSFFYSQTGLNSGNDQLATFRGQGQKLSVSSTEYFWDTADWIFGWEDLRIGSSDQDYNDMVVLVENLSPVPEPITTVLIMSGLAGLVGVGRYGLRKT